MLLLLPPLLPPLPPLLPLLPLLLLLLLQLPENRTGPKQPAAQQVCRASASHDNAPLCPVQEDIREPPLELYHRLKLYDDTGAANPKKPVRRREYMFQVY